MNYSTLRLKLTNEGGNETMRAHPNSREMSDYEKNFMVENYNKLSLAEIGRQLGVSNTYVRKKLIEMGVHEPRKEKHLKLKEIDRKLPFLEKGKTYRITEFAEVRIKEDLIAPHTIHEGNRVFTGTLFDVTNDLIILDNGLFKECVKKIDIITGDYKIEEVV